MFRKVEYFFQCEVEKIEFKNEKRENVGKMQIDEKNSKSRE